MKAMHTARAAFIVFALGWSFIAGAQIAVPPLTGRITDQTATLTAEQKATLEQTLQAFEARKGSQLAVLIVSTTAPETIEQFGLRVTEQWKLGRKKVDDGAILIIAKTDHALRIEVGYGLEGALTDATSKRIISEIITPRFKQEDFFGGITAGVNQIIRVIEGEPLPEPKARDLVTDSQRYVPIVFILALLIGGVLRSLLGRFSGALLTGGVVAILAWFFAGAIAFALGAGVIALLFTLRGGLGGLGGHGVGGHHGGIHTGGFSGGGGGFGGGGASGRW